jgi:hydroxymethylglutaryl-CoA synthase
MLQETEERYHSAPYEPKQSLDLLLPGTYYLEKIDEQSRRYYARIPCHAKL